MVEKAVRGREVERQRGREVERQEVLRDVRSWELVDIVLEMTAVGIERLKRLRRGSTKNRR